MNKSLIIDVPLYGHKIKVTVVTDIVGYIMDNYNEECKPSLVACIYDRMPLDDGIDFEAIFPINNCREDVIVHETFHVVARIMRSINVGLDLNSEETYAYLLDNLYTKIRRRTILIKQELNHMLDEITDKREEV